MKSLGRFFIVLWVLKYSDSRGYFDSGRLTNSTMFSSSRHRSPIFNAPRSQPNDSNPKRSIKAYGSILGRDHREHNLLNPFNLASALQQYLQHIPPGSFPSRLAGQINAPDASLVPFLETLYYERTPQYRRAARRGTRQPRSCSMDHPISAP